MRTNQFLLKVLLALQAIGINFIECEESLCDQCECLSEVLVNVNANKHRSQIVHRCFA
jgi:hypothetical protein